MSETKDYAAAAEWAERNDVPQTDRALRGDAAAAFAREQLERAGVPVGRPKLDPADTSAGRSPRRQVRLPQALSDDVDQVASLQGRDPSAVMRDAIAEYVRSHQQAG